MSIESKPGPEAQAAATGETVPVDPKVASVQVTTAATDRRASVMNLSIMALRLSVRCVTGACLVLASACHSSGNPGAEGVAGLAPPALTLQHATLINPGAMPVHDASVTIRNGRIACAGTTTACPRLPDSKSVDLAGAHIGPGLIDATVHYSQTGWLDGRPDALDLRAQYPDDSVVRARPKRAPRVDPDDILPEYDFSRGRRNLYASRMAGGHIIVLEPDVAKVFRMPQP